MLLRKNIKPVVSFIIVALLVLGCFDIAVYGQSSGKEEESFFVAQKAFDDGFHELAISLLERFLKNYPGSSQYNTARLLIAQCYYYQSKFFDSLKFLEQLLDDSLASNIRDAVLYWIAEVYVKGNNFIKAAEFYKRVIDEYPDSLYLANAYYSLGWCLYQQARYAEAIVNFERARGSNERIVSQDAFFKIIESLYNLKDFILLKTRIGEYLSVYPDDIAKRTYLYFYLGEADYYLNDFNRAIAEYSEVVISAPDEKMQSLAKIGRAWAYLKLKQYMQAEEAFLGIRQSSLDNTARDSLLLGRAALYFEIKKISELKDTYKEILKVSQDPEVLTQAYLGQAQSFTESSEYQEAIKTYQLILAKSDSLAISRESMQRVRFGLGAAFLKAGKIQEAIKEFQEGLSVTNDSALRLDALFNIAENYLELADYPKAEDYYNLILKEYPGNYYNDYVRYQLGAAQIKNVQYSEAIANFSNFAKDFPGSKLKAEALYSLGLCYFEKKDYTQAAKVLGELSKGFLTESDLRSKAIYIIGKCLYNQGEFNQAIEVFNSILAMEKAGTDLIQKAEYEIAESYYQLGDEKEALFRFNSLRSKYPASRILPQVIWWLGEYYSCHNDLSLSKRYFNSLIKDFPDDPLAPEAYYVLGLISSQEAKFQDGYVFLNKAIEIGGRELKQRATLAIADQYLKQDKVDLAIEVYNKSILDYPDSKGVIYPKLASLYFLKSDYQQALDYYKKGLECALPVQKPSLNFKLAETYEAAGKTNEALDEFLKFASIYPDDINIVTRALLRAARIYEEREDFGLAIKVYRRIDQMGVEESAYAQERIDFINRNNK